MFKTEIDNLINHIKTQMQPVFENVYFKNSWDLSGINDSVISQCYVSYINDKAAVSVKQGKRNEVSTYTLNMKAVFQFPDTYDFEKVLDQINYVISQKGTIESFILNSETIIKQETKITPTKIMPLILVNFAMKKHTLMSYCELVDKSC